MDKTMSGDATGNRVVAVRRKTITTARPSRSDSGNPPPNPNQSDDITLDRLGYAKAASLEPLSNLWEGTVRSPFLVAVGVLTLAIAGCAPNTESTTTAVQTQDETTIISGDPLIGTWVGFDEDGSGLELQIHASDGDYEWVFTDDHADLCIDFGSPVAVKLSGAGQPSADGAKLTSSRAVCVTDWGEVEVDLSVTMEMSLEGDTLTDGESLCLHQDDPTACGGIGAELANVPPNYAALIATYGQDWLTDNYQGDPSELLAQLDPCAVSTGPTPKEFEVFRAELADLPRSITCGPGGVWIYLRGVDGAALMGPDLQATKRLDGAGEPRGNKDLLVLHTFNTVDFLRDSKSEVTRVAEYPDSDYVRDAVPMGSDRILVTTNDITLFELDGSLVWTVPGDGYGRIVEGDDEYWAATPTGRLARIPKDGSEPLIIDIPDAVWAGSANLRPTPRIVDVPGGAVITNADTTVQFVSDNGELGIKIDVGPPLRGDSGHIIPVRLLTVVDGYVYTDDADGNVFRFTVDGTGEAEQVDSQPAGDALDAIWYFEFENIVARDDRGNVLTTILTGADPQNWTWVGSSLWITIQGGNQGAPGEVIEVRPAG